MPVAQSRTAQAQSDPQTQPLPHFNWSKAGLEDQQGGETHRLIGRGDVALERGIRGENAKLFANASCAVTSKLGKSYRVVMLFGPFGELQNALEEKVFLTQVCRVISWAFYFQLQALRLRDEQTHLETTKMLLQHRFRTALMPLAAHIGFAKQQLDRRLLDTTLKPMLERVKAAHELSLQLGRATRETVRSTDVMVERDDLRIDTYPLSVLAANCVNGFMEKASQEGRELILDASIENLPYAEIDIARMTIALSNLVDNALKYSFPGTKIYVRSLLPGISSVDLEHSVIAIQDIGEAVPNDKLESIFEKGERGLVEAKMGKIPGMGYGLWEARAILDAHGGSISVKSEETSMHYRQGYAHRVTFTVKIPLKQG